VSTANSALDALSTANKLTLHSKAMQIYDRRSNNDLNVNKQTDDADFLAVAFGCVGHTQRLFGLELIRQFPQKSPIFSGSLAKRDLHKLVCTLRHRMHVRQTDVADFLAVAFGCVGHTASAPIQRACEKGQSEHHGMQENTFYVYRRTPSLHSARH